MVIGACKESNVTVDLTPNEVTQVNAVARGLADSDELTLLKFRTTKTPAEMSRLSGVSLQVCTFKNVPTHGHL